MSTPPIDWVGQQASDGYEYLEYPFGSGTFWYRLIGSQQWLPQNPQVPQAAYNPETYQGSYSGFSTTPGLGNQFTTNPQPSLIINMVRVFRACLKLLICHQQNLSRHLIHRHIKITIMKVIINLRTLLLILVEIKTKG